MEPKGLLHMPIFWKLWESQSHGAQRPHSYAYCLEILRVSKSWNPKASFICLFSGNSGNLKVMEPKDLIHMPIFWKFCESQSHGAQRPPSYAYFLEILRVSKSWSPKASYICLFSGNSASLKVMEPKGLLHMPIFWKFCESQSHGAQRSFQDCIGTVYFTRF